jgi:hypothetical protein
VEKYGRAGHITDNNIIGRMCITCWVTKATDTHSEHEYFIIWSEVNAISTVIHTNAHCGQNTECFGVERGGA